MDRTNWVLDSSSLHDLLTNEAINDNIVTQEVNRAFGTTTSGNNWFTIDFGTTVNVAQVVVVKRFLWNARFKDIQIRLADSLVGILTTAAPITGGTLCGTYINGDDSEDLATITCAPGVAGRYLIIQSMVVGQLDMMEVYVYRA